MTLLRHWHRVTGALLIALTLLPVHRVLYGRQIGDSGRDTLAAGDRAWEIVLLGGAIVLAVAVLTSRLVSHDAVERWLQRVARALVRPSRLAFAAAAAALCAVFTGLFALFVLDGKPNLVDAMVQLLQARFIAEGTLTGPTLPSTTFWHMQNSVVTPHGWVSHFPPGYPVLMAVGHLLGAPWMISALLAGAAVFFTALTAERLLPERRAAVRLGVLLAAQSPFLLGLAGAQMNHVGAAAFVALALYAAVRGIEARGYGWPLVSGAALGAAFTIRPLAAVVAAVPVLVIAVHTRDGGARRVVERMLTGVAGALPFGLATAWYNTRFFGAPLRFGYEYAYGPNVGLGFRVDPWGNEFGPIEALGYTGSDLITLSLYLLESPFPIVALVGTYFLVTRQLSFGERIIVLWALLPVAASFFYWHHGIFMGPRMLNDVAPAWAVLVALSAAGIVRALPRNRDIRGYHPRTAAVAAFSLTFLAGVLYLTPERLLGYRTFMPSSRIAVPAAPDSALVFVHGAWTSRIVMRLAAAGMRLDSVETAMRENATCEVDAFSRLFAQRHRSSAAELPPLVFDPGARRGLPQVSVREEYTIRTDDRPLTPACARELGADRLGTVDVSPMLWQVRVPGLRGGGAMVVRDMGPEENAELIAFYPTLTPLMYYRPAPEAAPALSPYADAVRVIWGSDTGRVRSAATSSNENAD